MAAVLHDACRASAALAGLVFVAMSLHPWPILSNPLMRARAFASAFGFLLGVAWALIMLLPARTAPVASYLLIAVGVGESVVLVYRQFQVRTVGMSVARVVVADILIPIPFLAGILGLLLPASRAPFLLLLPSRRVWRSLCSFSNRGRSCCIAF